HKITSRECQFSSDFTSSRFHKVDQPCAGVLRYVPHAGRLPDPFAILTDPCDVITKRYFGATILKRTDDCGRDCRMCGESFSWITQVHATHVHLDQYPIPALHH